MATIIICDIDGTLDMGSGRPNTTLIAKLQEAAKSRSVFIVSGRPDKRLAETKKWLEENAVPHAAVHLSDFPTGPNAAVAFKKYKAELLMQEGYEIAVAIDNDLRTREMYRSLGIRAVSPSRF